MEKKTCRSYEYLSESKSSSVGEYLIFNENGTFLNNSQMQYVTHVQDVSPCRVYDIATAQYYMDGDNPELISVSVSGNQLVLTEENNSTCSKNFYFQDPNIQALQDIKPKLNQFGVIETEGNRETVENFTEITLNEEQGRMFEEKGWILLEINGKVFLLDTAGLHDITDKKGVVNRPTEEFSENIFCKYETDVKPEISNLQIQELLSKNTPSDENIHEGAPISDTIVQKQCAEKAVDDQPVTKEVFTTLNHGEKEIYIYSKPILDDETKESIKRIQISDLKLNVNDIPHKIFIGKSKSGKNLYAKVVDIKSNAYTGDDMDSYQETNDDTNKQNDKDNFNKYTNGYIDLKLLLQLIFNDDQSKYCFEEEVREAEYTMSALLSMPAPRQMLCGRKIIISKAVKKLDSPNDAEIQLNVALVAGKIVQCNDSGSDCWHFEHSPELLRKLLHSHFNATENDKSEIIFNTDDDPCLFHVHVTDIECPNNPTTMSVKIVKHKLPLKHSHTIKKRKLDSVHACSACAAVFNSEEKLLNHHKASCGKKYEVKPLSKPHNNNSKQQSDNDTESSNSGQFCCTECHSIFSRISNYRRHMSIHFKPKVNLNKSLKIVCSPNSLNTQSEAEDPSIKKGQYKCNICCSYYNYATTLTKHIMTKHIRSLE